MQRSRAHGFTLVEVLVAMFVLTLGVAGAAAAQLGAERLRQQAALESEAVQLAASIAARMRVNALQMALPDASNPYLGFAYDAADGEPGAPPVQCFGAADCTPAQLAAFDLHESAQLVQRAFPGGRLVVCRDAGDLSAWACTAAPAAPVVVKLGWRRPARHADAAVQDGPVVMLVVAA